MNQTTHQCEREAKKLAKELSDLVCASEKPSELLLTTIRDLFSEVEQTKNVAKETLACRPQVSWPELFIG